LPQKGGRLPSAAPPEREGGRSEQVKPTKTLREIGGTSRGRETLLNQKERDRGKTYVLAATTEEKGDENVGDRGKRKRK